MRKCIMETSVYVTLTGLILRYAAQGSSQGPMELNLSCPHGNLLICDPRIVFQINYM